MKAFLTVVLVCLLVLGAAGVGLLSWQVMENRQLKAANTALSTKLQSAEDTMAKISLERDTASLKFELLEARERELRERVDSLETAAKADVDSKPRPYRVRAFLGRDNVGDAWMVPRDVKWDEQIGRYTFEPVLWIDESSKGFFTVYETNVVDRNIYNTEIYQEDNGYPFYPYYYAGINRPWPTNRPPGNPQPPTQLPVSSPGISQQPDARTRIFAPPMSIVNTRPQVMGRPATSPINVQVFAP